MAHGPKPRDYSERTNKKMKRLALRSALSDRAAEGNVMVVSEWGFDAPSTKAGKAALAELGVSGKVLVVTGRDDELVWKSLRNLPEVQLLTSDQLNTSDVLGNDFVVFTEACVPSSTNDETEGSES